MEEIYTLISWIFTVVKQFPDRVIKPKATLFFSALCAMFSGDEAFELRKKAGEIIHLLVGKYQSDDYWKVSFYQYVVIHFIKIFEFNLNFPWNFYLAFTFLYSMSHFSCALKRLIKIVYKLRGLFDSDVTVRLTHPRLFAPSHQINLSVPKRDGHVLSVDARMTQIFI